MELGDLIETRPQLLIGIIQNNNQTYGDKFEKFSQQVFQSFERVAAIRFSQNSYARQRLPLAIFAAIIFNKNHRFLNEDFSGLQFLDDFKTKTKAIAAASPNINIDKIMDLMRAKISSNHLRLVFDVNRLSTEVHDLMNLFAEYKSKGEVEHYTEEQTKRISSFFGERLVLINYDEDKSALSQMTFSHRNVYLLKAKEMYFILFKEQEIELLEKGTLTHEQLAIIFNVQYKLEKSPQKSINPYADPNPVMTSPTKSANELKKSSKGQASQPSASQIQAKKGSELTLSRIKHSVLFPDEVTCTYCCKKVSQFSAIFWNYSYYCFECVLSPKKDISFIPSSLIQKFLKGQKIESREYLLICPECKSDTIIPNYRPWDKPKNYKCKACQKEICVEHEKMVGECFCKCIQCDKPTITIPTVFIKYCLSCKTRLCEICNIKGKKECLCICPKCGENQKVDHETCKPRCHSCHASDVPLMPCLCSNKLCPACYFYSLDPKSAICVLK